MGEKRGWMSGANAITVGRILLIPFFMFFAVGKFPSAALIALILFIVGAVSDFFDGFLARRWGTISVFGQFADPLADKLLVASAFLIFLEDGFLSAVFVMVIIGREFLVMGLRLLAISRGKVISARGWGKVKTVGQILLVIWIFVGQILGWGQETLVVKTALIYLVAFLTLVSGFFYFVSNPEVFSEGAGTPS